MNYLCFSLWADPSDVLSHHESGVELLQELGSLRRRARQCQCQFNLYITLKRKATDLKVAKIFAANVKELEKKLSDLIPIRSGVQTGLLTSCMMGGAVSQWSFSRTVLGRFSARRVR